MRKKGAELNVKGGPRESELFPSQPKNEGENNFGDRRESSRPIQNTQRDHATVYPEIQLEQTA